MPWQKPSCIKSFCAKNASVNGILTGLIFLIEGRQSFLRKTGNAINKNAALTNCPILMGILTVINRYGMAH